MSGEPRATILLREYAAGVEATDRFGKDEVQPIVLGLFGEVGSVMSAVKKHKREGSAFIGFRQTVEEEFGDALWYLVALCRRMGISVEEIFADVAKNGKYSTAIAASNVPGWPLSEVVSVTNMPKLDDVLLGLGRSAASLLSVVSDDKDVRSEHSTG
jgi:NTP pyrophosphatase (non-canonical NTP hydrolase)